MVQKMKANSRKQHCLNGHMTFPSLHVSSWKHTKQIIICNNLYGFNNNNNDNNNNNYKTNNIKCIYINNNYYYYFKLNYVYLNSSVT